MIFLEVLLFILGVALFTVTLSSIIGVPFLPTHHKQARAMMEFAALRPGLRVVDLGSGAGRLLFLAAERGADAVGYELNPVLYFWTLLVIKLKGLSGRVSVRCQSLYQADLSGADVVFAFLFPKPMAKLAPKLFTEMKPGATIISYAFSIPGHTPIKKEQGIFVYKV
ncbi:MAG: hypothetical protein HY983_02205 [Candidatus Magasanikbacteria bacterium]|nr:hypothetical protein [Candidatus Magasanikbacteria bacterium]